MVDGGWGMVRRRAMVDGVWGMVRRRVAGGGRWWMGYGAVPRRRLSPGIAELHSALAFCRRFPRDRHRPGGCIASSLGPSSCTRL